MDIDESTIRLGAFSRFNRLARFLPPLSPTMLDSHSSFADSSDHISLFFM